MREVLSDENWHIYLYVNSPSFDSASSHCGAIFSSISSFGLLIIFLLTGLFLGWISSKYFYLLKPCCNYIFQVSILSISTKIMEENDNLWTFLKSHYLCTRNLRKESNFYLSKDQESEAATKGCLWLYFDWRGGWGKNTLPFRFFEISPKLFTKLTWNFQSRIFWLFESFSKNIVEKRF